MLARSTSVNGEGMKQEEKERKIYNFLLGSIAAISLLVGGIGIMNIMLATVLERTILTAAASPPSAFSFVRARKVTRGTAVVKRAPLPRPIAPLAPSTTTCLISREANKSADLPLAAVVVDNILSPFCASAVYKLTRREPPMWVERIPESNETVQKQAFTSDLQSRERLFSGQLAGITAICLWAC